MLNSYLEMHDATTRRLKGVKVKRCPKGSRVCKTGEDCPGDEFRHSPSIYTGSGECFSKEALREPVDVRASRAKLMKLLEMGARFVSYFDQRLDKYACKHAGDKDACGMAKACKWADDACTSA